MLHLGTWPWTSDSNRIPIDPADYTNLPTWDKVQLVAIGPVPILGFAYSPGIGDWTQQTNQWLHKHGFREATVRLVLDGATSDNPCPLTGDMAQKAQDLSTQMSRWLAWDANFSVWWQVDNEPDLERQNQDPAEYAAKLDELIAALEGVFPGQAGRFLRPPLAQGSPKFDQFFAALLPGCKSQPYVCGHYYWGGTFGPYVAGAKATPEWLAQQTGKAVIVGECGNLDSKHDVDYVFKQWVGNPAILRWHHWKFSGESYAKDNFDTDSVNYARDFAHDIYRGARSFPVGATVTPPPPPPDPGSFDKTALRNHMSAQKALADAVAGYAKEMQDRVAGVWSDYQL